MHGVKRAGKLVSVFLLLAISSGCGDDDPAQPEPPGPEAVCIDYRDYLHIAATCKIPSGSSRLGDVAVEGDMAFIANGYSGLQVVDVADPSSPAIVGSVISPNAASSRVEVFGNHAYVMDEFAGLKVVDITIPALPVYVAVAGNFSVQGKDIAITPSGMCVISGGGLGVVPLQCDD